MSYTTRRTGGIPGKFILKNMHFFNYQCSVIFSLGNQQANSVGGIGQRRPVVTNNFVPGAPVSSFIEFTGLTKNTVVNLRNIKFIKLGSVNRSMILPINKLQK